MSARRLALAAATGAVLAVAVAACGTDEGDGSATVTRTVVQRTTPTTTTPVQPNDPGFGIGGAGTEGTPGAASTDLGAVGGTGSVEGSIYRPFSPQSPWNTTVQGMPVDPASDRLIQEAQERVGVTERGDFVTTQRRRIDDPLFINTTEWTVPVVDEEGGVPTRVVCRQIPPDCGDGRDVETLLIPPNESPRPQYDGWFTVLNRREGVAYDMWRARRGQAGAADAISYQFMRKWALNGPGYQRPNSVSARGSGLPLFAGLLLPEEIEAGRIDHALAISVPGPAQRNYVQPASATDGNGRLSSLPEGARIRLRAERYDALISLPTCPANRLRDSEGEVRSDCVAPRTNRRAARAILEALRRYGAIVVDRSRTPTLYAKLNADWRQPLRGPDGRLLKADGRTPLPRRLARLRNEATPLLRGNEVQFLRLSDFEVVQLGEVLKFPPLGATPVAAQTFTPVVP
ncbi:MAG TPA: hypothetical protein VFR97_00430 [Capillimicrobium sp.]|nr:hypothetical protein [Capillimicrobium sp.]